MVDLWNKVFEYSIDPIKAYRNKINDPKLVRIYKTIFNSDLDEWRKYAYKVNSSQFLMGEKQSKNNFKATFSWLIKEETIEKVLNGEYGVGDRELDEDSKSKYEEYKKEAKVKELESEVIERIKVNIDEIIEWQEFR